MRISIMIDAGEEKILKKRAKKNLFSLREQIEDIIRRSCVTYKGGGPKKIKVDDKLVAIFSREKRGKKKKKGVKKK
jgi:hypothetical protein